MYTTVFVFETVKRVKELTVEKYWNHNICYMFLFLLTIEILFKSAPKSNDFPWPKLLRRFNEK